MKGFLALMGIGAVFALMINLYCDGAFTSAPVVKEPTAAEMAQWQAEYAKLKANNDAACAAGLENRCVDPYNPNQQPPEDYNQFMSRAYKALNNTDDDQ
jgi:hypothetical protein